MQSGDTCLHLASYKGHLEIVKFLVQKGGKKLASILNEDSRTALDDATHREQMDVVKFLQFQ